MSNPTNNIKTETSEFVPVDAELNQDILETPPKNAVALPHEEAEAIMDNVRIFDEQ